MEADKKRYRKKRHRCKYMYAIAMALIPTMALGGCGDNKAVENPIDVESTVVAEDTATVLTQISEDVKVEGNVLTFDRLCLTLPENTAVELVTLEEGSEAICLSAIESPYDLPVEIFLRHYQVEWQQTYTVRDFMVALMELTGLTDIMSRYIDEENKEAMFQLADNDWYGWSAYAVVRGNDIYLVEELDNSTDFSFSWWFFEDGDILYWKDTGEELLSSWDDKRYRCLKIVEPDGKIFYAYSYDKENRVYEQVF